MTETIKRNKNKIKNKKKGLKLKTKHVRHCN